MSSDNELFIGIDIGTSGVRAVCTDSDMVQHSMASMSFTDISGSRTEASVWAQAVELVLSELFRSVSPQSVKAIAVDGTSGTIIMTDPKGHPLCDAMMYNDTCEDAEILGSIKKHAPENSAAHGASSGLAKAILLSRSHPGALIQHEADWIASALSGQNGLSDENNSLKTGYDPVTGRWPDWLDETEIKRSQLPKVLRAGEPIGMAQGWLAKQCGLSETVLVVAGTTDGCASFLATGAAEPGDGVTVLGSTLTLKLLSDRPIYSPLYGIYSHKIGNTWLAGGASNTGGRVLDHYFERNALESMSATINTTTETGLDYYPLVVPGERFPINDSTLLPKLDPRPIDDSQFLKGMLEGISAIEKLAYGRLEELGGPPLRTVRTMGGGANNKAWTQIRENFLGVPFSDCLSDHAATGAAVLAKRGALEAGMAS